MSGRSIALVVAAALLLLLGETGRGQGGAARSVNYAPADYHALLARVGSTVGIADARTRRILASGVVVAEDLVLTCRHVTHRGRGAGERRLPRDLCIRRQDGDGRWREHPVHGYAWTSERLDVCLLAVGEDAGGRLLPACAVRRLGAPPPGPDAPVYVVHHPRGGALAIADDARVVVPWGGGALGPAARRWGGQPVFGIDAETRGGSSGAPVYAKGGHALLGILIAGSSRRAARRGDVRRLHEAVLAGTAILADLPPALGARLGPAATPPEGAGP